MEIPRMLLIATRPEVLDQNMEVEVKKLIVVRRRVSGDSPEHMFYFYELDGTLVAITNPARERDWSK